MSEPMPPSAKPEQQPRQARNTAGLGLATTLPGVGAALLPAVTCPACWPAYAGLLGSMGLGFIDYSPWLLPVMVVFLGISLLTLAWQGYKRRRYGPLLMGSIGAALIVFDRIEPGSELVLYSGVLLLIAASIWNAWPRKARIGDAAGDCARCQADVQATVDQP